MNYEIHNLSHRLVSVHCNSGKTCHLPPGCKHEFPEQEISGNSSVKKLTDRKLIMTRQSSKSSAEKPKISRKAGAKMTKAKKTKKTAKRK